MTTPELDKKAEERCRQYAKSMIDRMDKEASYWRLDTPSLENVLTAMCQTISEHLQAENARISEEHNKLADKYLKLSADYADLYERRKTIEQVQTPVNETNGNKDLLHRKQ